MNEHTNKHGNNIQYQKYDHHPNKLSCQIFQITEIPCQKHIICLFNVIPINKISHNKNHKKRLHDPPKISIRIWHPGRQIHSVLKYPPITLEKDMKHCNSQQHKSAQQ